jgi:hypothetical protein
LIDGLKKKTIGKMQAAGVGMVESQKFSLVPDSL